MVYTRRWVIIPLRPWLLVQPEILYAQKGARTTTSRVVGDPPRFQFTSRDWRYEYLEVAALLHLKSSRRTTADRFGLLVGPVVSRQINGNRSVPHTCIYPQRFRTTDIGLALGTSLAVGRATVELRFEGLGRRLSSGDCAESRGKHIYGAFLLGFPIS